jgi:hypothetical protein
MAQRLQPSVAGHHYRMCASRQTFRQRHQSPDPLR